MNLAGKCHKNENVDFFKALKIRLVVMISMV